MAVTPATDADWGDDGVDVADANLEDKATPVATQTLKKRPREEMEAEYDVDDPDEEQVEESVEETESDAPETPTPEGDAVGESDETEDDVDTGPDPELVDAAIELGLSETVARTLTDKQLIGVLKDFRQKAEAEPEEPEDDPLEGLDPEDVHPPILEAFKKQQAKLTKQEAEIADLKKDMAKQADDKHAADQADHIAWFDDKIKSLGDAGAKIFGEGSVNNLHLKSKALKFREDLNEQVEDYRINAEARGRPAASRDERFARAIRAEYPKLANTIASASDKKAADDRRNLGSPRPSRRTGQDQSKEPFGTKRAEQGLKTWFRERKGIDVPDQVGFDDGYNDEDF